MALTYGFYNSYAGDRKYDAMQISEMFDGILADGIIPSQGQLFAVTAGGGMTVNVGTGRAWFFHSWTKNDSVMMLTVPASDVSRPRIDAVVLEVNRDQEVRANSIKIVSGEAAVNPVKPTLVTTDKVHQYPLAYITVGAGVEEIKAENIENAVGLTPTPFATGVLETAPLDELWSQWEGEWDTWFANIKLQLSGDIVTNLQGQIDELRERLSELDGLKVVTNTYTKIYTSSGVFTNSYSSPLEVAVHAFGGGGGGSREGGGGGGHRVLEIVTIPPNDTVNIEIGAGGSKGNSGGATSFGSYVKAVGGSAPTSSAGGNGGSGGGATNGGRGGDATYGGGGGASGKQIRSGGNPPATIVGARGGNGGTYGGGGGGGGAGGGGSVSGGSLPGFSSAGGSGGSGGAQGGSGGDGGSVAFAGTASTAYESGNDGGVGTNTEGTTEEFIGPGSFGTGGNGSYTGETRNPGTPNQNQNYAICGGGGGGGGGYGGNGGSSSDPASAYLTSATYGIIPAGGGGGGGYGGNGGAGVAAIDTAYSKVRNITSAGGGGGGYGGNGGDAVAQGVHTTLGGSGNGRSGEGYGSGGGSTGIANGSSGSYSGKYATAGGGGGYGKTPASAMTDSGRSGICIVTYTVKEIVIE